MEGVHRELKTPVLSSREAVMAQIRDDLHTDFCEKIYESTYFQKALGQQHHYTSTVARHTMAVTAVSLRLYYILQQHGIRLNKEVLTKAALCHDLGIVGRHEKFANNLVCCFQHPVDSVKAAREIFPELDARTADCIKHHMWPQGWLPPHHLEGFVLILADKYCATRDAINGRKYLGGVEFLPPTV